MHKQQAENESHIRPDGSAQMRAVTISREYGSGGGEIARRLARRLNWQLVDHEVVVHLARRLGISEQEAAVYDEHAAGFLERLVISLRNIDPVMMINSVDTMKPEELYHRALHQVVTAAAREHHVVIVGRGSQVVLADRRDVLHVRIVAPMEQRIAYVMQREGMERDDARQRIQMKDRDRQRYLQTQYQRDSRDPHLYDLVCNTSVIHLDSVVDIVCLALECKAARLKMHPEELGPIASASERYPARPGDFRPPESMQD